MTAFDHRLPWSDRKEAIAAKYETAVAEFQKRGPDGADRFRAHLKALGCPARDISSEVYLNWPGTKQTPAR